MIAPSGCTMNFIFRKSGAYGIGTAGHCVNGVGQEVVLLTLAPGGGNPVLVEVGKVVVHVDKGIGADFALVSVRPQLSAWVDPTIAVVAGPCGAYGGSGPETVAHYGHGLAIGTGGTPRAGVALTWNAASFGWDGAAIFGDSGSPVRVTRLQAAGNLTHLVVDTRWLPSFIAGTRIGKMLGVASGWSLVSSGCASSRGAPRQGAAPSRLRSGKPATRPRRVDGGRRRSRPPDVAASTREAWTRLRCGPHGPPRSGGAAGRARRPGG